MIKVLIDSDVVLDYLFQRESHYQHAARILQYCELGKIQGFLTPVIIANLYYILRKTASHQRVISALSRLLQIVDVFAMDKETIRLAIDSSFKDFEDALQHAAAFQHSTANIVITRNLKDYKQADLAVYSPETFIDLFPSI